MLPVTALYASLLALWIVWLAKCHKLLLQYLLFYIILINLKHCEKQAQLNEKNILSAL